MNKLRSYISMLMMALLLFPMVEKVVHEVSHLNDDHCGVKETHFCAKEHHCELCDYIFSSSPSCLSPQNHHQLYHVIESGNDFFIALTSLIPNSTPFQISLRGPPVC